MKNKETRTAAEPLKSEPPRVEPKPELKPEPNTSGVSGGMPPQPPSNLPPSIADVRAGKIPEAPVAVGVPAGVTVGVDSAGVDSDGFGIEVLSAPVDPDKPAIVVRRALYRRKPLLVEAAATSEGWIVKEAGREVAVSKDEFELLYEVALDPAETLIDAGLPDLELGTEISKDGRRLVRVKVLAGRGGVAYWAGCKNNGGDAGYVVTADLIDNEQAAHRAGRFVEPWEGKPGGKTWVEVRGSEVKR